MNRELEPSQEATQDVHPEISKTVENPSMSERDLRKDEGVVGKIGGGRIEWERNPKKVTTSAGESDGGIIGRIGQEETVQQPQEDISAISTEKEGTEYSYQVLIESMRSFFKWPDNQQKAMSDRDNFGIDKYSDDKLRESLKREDGEWTSAKDWGLDPAYYRATLAEIIRRQTINDSRK